tara:strand:- start:151 stop:549 length:399 start_codon:yes stop_codon:yes gene_type:complete
MRLGIESFVKIFVQFLKTTLKEFMMSQAKLINFSTADFSSKAEMQMNFNNWTSNRKKHLPKLKSLGMLRFTVLRVWNKEGAFRLGYIFEYKDEEAYKKCQPIWQGIEGEIKNEAPVKIFANRGIVLEDNDLT